MSKRWTFLKKRMIDTAIQFFNTAFACGILVTLFWFYEYFGKTLTVASFFTIMQIYNNFKQKIYDSADLINSFTEAMVSIRRLNCFFISEELSYDNIRYARNAIEDDKNNDRFAALNEDDRFRQRPEPLMLESGKMSFSEK